ncbi:hypothetical protein PENTCL1PPCAC_6431, partial [Pristionchus entomophagus]
WRTSKSKFSKWRNKHKDWNCIERRPSRILRSVQSAIRRYPSPPSLFIDIPSVSGARIFECFVDSESVFAGKYGRRK